MTDNIINFENKRKVKEGMREAIGNDYIYVTVVIPTSDSSAEAFIEYDERMNPYQVVGVLDFGKKLIFDSAED